jgi:hypothetical protein
MGESGGKSKREDQNRPCRKFGFKQANRKHLDNSQSSIKPCVARFLREGSECLEASPTAGLDSRSSAVSLLQYTLAHPFSGSGTRLNTGRAHRLIQIGHLSRSACVPEELSLHACVCTHTHE